MQKTYHLFIGMEIHVELKTLSKMFCGCKNDPFHAVKPNMHTCPTCLGMPGGLPVANKKAIDWTMKLGLALGCNIATFSKFDRKHYFYPDLAKGYQISQYNQPLCESGVVRTAFGDVRIRRVHLEEDTGKLQHISLKGKPVTLIDFNRSGVPLVEIVTEPDIHSAEHAKGYAKAVYEIVRALNISDADMEKGSMRLEANISLSQNPNDLPQYKVEVKNINSFRFLEQAIRYETERQMEILEQGKIPEQETRGWNEGTKSTQTQRSKENAEDYRYFPDPDLPPMVFSPAQIDEMRNTLPELPDQRRIRYEADGIKPEFALLLSSSDHSVDTLEKVFALARTQKITPSSLATVIVNKKVDTFKTSPEEIVMIAQKTYAHDSVNEDELHTAVASVIADQPKAVADYKAGKTQVIGFLIGMVMKKIGKKVDMQIVRLSISKFLD